MSDGGGAFFCRKRRIYAEDKMEFVVFTAVTAWIMVYIMTLYNIVLVAGTLSWLCRCSS